MSYLYIFEMSCFPIKVTVDVLMHELGDETAIVFPCIGLTWNTWEY